MKKLSTVFLMVIASLFLNSCMMDNCIEGNGRETTESRTLDEFSGIEVGGAYKLMLTRDQAQSLAIRADENVVPYIKTEVRNGRLHIFSDENICDEVEIAISMAELTDISASGAVDVETTNRFTTGEFLLDASGAVEANLDIEAEKIRTRLSGAGEIEYRGKAGRHQVNISGAGELNAFDLVANQYDIDLSGAAACSVHVLSELNVQASGASSVRYRGKPSVINQDISGAGSVKAATAP